MNREILRLAIPNTISTVSVPLPGIVDTALVGHMEVVHFIGGLAAVVIHDLAARAGVSPDQRRCSDLEALGAPPLVVRVALACIPFALATISVVAAVLHLHHKRVQYLVTYMIYLI